MKTRELAHLHAFLRERGLLEPLTEVCREAHSTLDNVLSKSRLRTTVKARGLCCLFLRGKGFSYEEIGTALNVDPSGVYYVIKRIEAVKAAEAERKAAGG